MKELLQGLLARIDRGFDADGDPALIERANEVSGHLDSYASEDADTRALLEADDRDELVSIGDAATKAIFSSPTEGEADDNNEALVVRIADSVNHFLEHRDAVSRDELLKPIREALSSRPEGGAVAPAGVFSMEEVAKIAADMKAKAYKMIDHGSRGRHIQVTANDAIEVCSNLLKLLSAPPAAAEWVPEEEWYRIRSYGALIENLRAEGQTSRADAVAQLVGIADSAISEIARLRTQSPAHSEHSGDTVLAPRKATPAMLDRAVSFALSVSLSSEYTWSQYMADLWVQMLGGIPENHSEHSLAMVGAQAGAVPAKVYDDADGAEEFLDANYQPGYLSQGERIWFTEGWTRHAELAAPVAADERELPMDTAPRDGTEILVFFKRLGWKQVAWDSPHGDDYAIWCVDDNKNDPYPLRGYSDGDEVCWMPLPPDAALTARKANAAATEESSATEDCPHSALDGCQCFKDGKLVKADGMGGDA